ncbi:hypothetical protein JTB14_001065 [Gonioctena quinquepunctata]|nr:hypothetical protein JTB14_001065 [Gonioctena quinquepunctata]
MPKSRIGNEFLDMADTLCHMGFDSFVVLVHHNIQFILANDTIWKRHVRNVHYAVFISRFLVGPDCDTNNYFIT